ncbi:hypothetical protein DAEQUDRAFT_721194 [Daedalea quercina L-15889]|uniref:UspA domain-containing protein n=1 Tax=Daedalea quercina L-15889 TaxID=1314783 RepID=A0A165TP94_9APHY|nr:hypothetical protein DAEQUDRAFT_721194 [Daedalea quercina L-15889]
MERLREPDKTSKSASESKSGSYLGVPDYAASGEAVNGENALSRNTSRQSDAFKSPTEAIITSQRGQGSFSRMSLSSMMGGLSSLSLSRGGDDKERGRTEKKDKDKSSGLGFRSSSFSGATGDAQDAMRGRARSQSPFRLRRARTRDISPSVEALSYSDAESDSEAPQIHPRNAFSLGAASDDEDAEDSEEEDESEEEWSGEEKDQFDPVTERNTEHNALISAEFADQDVVDVPDPLGEGVNVVVPPEPYFPSTLNHSTHNPRRRKSMRPDPLPIDTSRPVFQRDRCTITITHGDPARVLRESGGRNKRYVLASDLSDESRYALEWGIGTVLRDGDELLIVTVIENESKVDPPVPNQADRAAKLRAQQERQALAYILVRQAVSLLQRTRLHVTISCQAWHAKNRKHMILDIVDYVEPSMLIVGSRGLGHLKGILLGSTSHYLVQKCSVPVMVARRRLKRPQRVCSAVAPHRARVSLAQAAGVDRMAPKVDQDVANMRDQMQREEEDGKDAGPHPEADDDPDVEAEGVEDALGRKVAGN